MRNGRPEVARRGGRRILTGYVILGLVSAMAASARPGAAQVENRALPGGEPPGPTASLFAPRLVSSEGAWEYGVAVTADWSELYFTRLAGERSTIMVSRRTGAAWSSPIPASFSGRHDDSHPSLTSSGDTLFFVSQRPCPGARQALNVWFAERTATGWTAPRSPGRPVIDQTVHAPSLSGEGTIYATGLIRLPRAGERYLPAEPLAPAISGSQPVVARDESFLVFSARRAGGFGGTDLYVAFRQPDGSWSDPVNLGRAVNTDRVESSPTLSGDGRFLFFSRDGDVWWVDATVIASAGPRTSTSDRPPADRRAAM